MDKKIPGWIVGVVGALFRFVAGAFGAKVPHPWPTGFCWPFWLVLIGVTVGLPIVLVAWVIRLTFKGKLARQITGIIVGAAYVGFIAFVLWTGFIWLLWRLGSWKILIITLSVIAAIAVIWGLIKLIGRVRETDWYFARLAVKWQREEERDRQRWAKIAAEGPEKKEPKKPGPVKWFFVKVWEVLRTLGLVVYAGYKKFCPRVEFP